MRSKWIQQIREYRNKTGDNNTSTAKATPIVASNGQDGKMNPVEIATTAVIGTAIA